MDLKLQQAIVATRAGRTDVAQSLLTQLINEKPDDANAWFLLGHIVDSRDRQLLYLQKALALDPTNPIARKQVAQLVGPGAPPPVVAHEKSENASVNIPVEEEAVKPEAAVLASADVVATQSNKHQTPDVNPGHLPVQEAKTAVSQKTGAKKEDDWPKSARTPKRDSKASTKKTQVVHVPQDQSQAISNSDRTPEEVWLLRILAVLVVIAVIVLAFLVLLIFL